MQMNQVQQRIERIEQCVDDAEAALRSGSAPDDLRQCVDRMHEQSRQARQMVQQSSDASNEEKVRDCVDSLEQLGDRAVQACRSGGGSVDPQVQQAVQRAHDEISDLKKQMH